MNCEHQPWLIDPAPGRYLYVKMFGTYMREPVIDEYNLSNNITILHDDKDYCMTRNRIAIYPGTLPPVIVCPWPASYQRHHVVEVFSEGWSSGGNVVDFPMVASMPAIDQLGQEHARTIAVEYIGRDSGSYSITWLELTRRYLKISH